MGMLLAGSAFAVAFAGTIHDDRERHDDAGWERLFILGFGIPLTIASTVGGVFVGMGAARRSMRAPTPAPPEVQVNPLFAIGPQGAMIGARLRL